jgi:hypothetical protein
MDKLLDVKPVWLLLAVGGMFVVSLMVAVGAMASLGVFGPVFSVLPTPLPVGTPQASETPVGSLSIGGSIWHDRCAGEAAGQPGPSSTPPGCVWVGSLGAFAADGVRQSDEPGIGGVLVELGPGACPSLGLATTFTADDGSYAFGGISPGNYCVSVDPALGANSAILAPGQWSSPDRTNGRIQVGIAVGPDEGATNIDLGWDYQFLPAPEPSRVPSSTATPSLTECSDKAKFVADVTIPDGSSVKAGSSFTKTWRMTNTGTCSWDTSYAIVFASGERMGGGSPNPLPGIVAPGSTVDLGLNLVAPSASGSYKGNWLIRNPAGALFGIGSQGDQPFWVQIVVGPTATPVPAPWKAEFFDNRNVKGSPDLTRQDPAIDFDWKDDAPASGMPKDDFSARWTGQFAFDMGAYRFEVLVDDGARLWVDDQLIIDEWADGGEREFTTVVGLAKGNHDVRLEYYDHTREARVRLKWEKVESPGYADWKAEFWPNRDLSGDSILVRNDTKIAFDWGSDAPAVGVPTDNFSVRWTRKLNFDEGTYRFNVKADDGVRVYVDGQCVINGWHDSGGDSYHVDLNLSGKRKIVVEYYEHGGEALVEFSWERVSPTPTKTPTLTNTPTATEIPPSPTLTPTPTSTPTETQSPTPTFTPTTVPSPSVVFDFVDRACTATWSNGEDALGCPGQRGDSQGYVLSLGSPILETGSQATGVALLAAPPAAEGGSIEGTFPLFSVQPGDHFKTTLGCAQDQTECSTSVQLSYLTVDDELKPKLLGSWTESYDGQVNAVDLDLASLAGKTISFVLTVRSNMGAGQDVALWVNPVIWR